MNGDQRHVFLSYASTDRERALAIAGTLEAAGVSVWVDRRAIPGAASWDAEIVRGIADCSGLVLLCSPSGMTSPNVQQATEAAVPTGESVGFGSRRTKSFATISQTPRLCCSSSV